MKKILLTIVIILIIIIPPAFYFLIYPIFRVVAVDDQIPGLDDSVSVRIDPNLGLVEVTPNREPITDTVGLPTIDDGFEDRQIVETAPIIETINRTITSPTSSPTEPQKEFPIFGELSNIVGTLGHPAEGTARIVETAQGKFVRLEDFKTIDGPRLNVYLSTGLDARNFIDLGRRKGTQGNINYEVPEGTDLTKYKYVIHWCVPFSVLFNHAELK